MGNWSFLSHSKTIGGLQVSAASWLYFSTSWEIIRKLAALATPRRLIRHKTSTLFVNNNGPLDNVSSTTGIVDDTLRL